MKQRLKGEGNESVTDCHGLKMVATDGIMRKTDVADTEPLYRLIQSIPSPKFVRLHKKIHNHDEEPSKGWGQFVTLLSVDTQTKGLQMSCNFADKPVLICYI